MKFARFAAFNLLTMICLSFVGKATAQDAVPVEILQRTLMIRTTTEQGTGFLIDHRGKVYVITARHVVAGLPSVNASLQTRREGRWENVRVSKILYPSSDNVDIAVLVTDEIASQPYSIGCVGSSGGPTMGQQVWFLGFPFLEGLGSHLHTKENANIELPFIKRATMSAIDGRDPNAVVMYFDGFNNKGFSGGPILYWDFSAHAYKVAGVVQGYKNDTVSALVNGQQVATNLLVNSGIIVAFDINAAIAAIDKNLDSTPTAAPH